MKPVRPHPGSLIRCRPTSRWFVGGLALVGAALALSGGGCMSAPPEVAADLTAPDGRRPNHYALQPGADEKPAAGAKR